MHFWKAHKAPRVSTDAANKEVSSSGMPSAVRRLIGEDGYRFVDLLVCALQFCVTIGGRPISVGVTFDTGMGRA